MREASGACGIVVSVYTGTSTPRILPAHHLSPNHQIKFTECWNIGRADDNISNFIHPLQHIGQLRVDR